MAVSQNGWPVLSGYSDKNLVPVPHIIGKVRGGDVATILSDLARRWHAEIEDLDVGKDDWGFAPRPISGTTIPSNHASGTGVDFNASKHPQFRDTFTSTKKTNIRKLIASYDGVLRWGGDYRADRLDQMHVEINAGSAAVAKVATRLRNGGGTTTTVPKPPKVTASQGSTTLLYRGNPKNNKARVKKLQAGLNRVFPSYANFAGNGDGDYGEYTVKVVKEFQRRSGLKPDGVVGPDTIKALRKHGIKL